MAAASEGVGVQHVGAFTLLLLPGAYVALDSGALATLGPWRTLRVRPSPLEHSLPLCLGSFVMATMDAWAKKQNNPAPEARRLSFGSMLAEPVIPALPVSQQLQDVLSLSETTWLFSVAIIHRCPSAIMHTCTVRPNQDGPA